jgi:hypothetical protein
MAKIFLSVPILGKPELKMMYSMYQAILSAPQHRVRLYFNENDSLISRVRNVHISSFLNDFKECDYFMSLDSDIEILNAYVNNNIFSKLVACNLDFVGGLYALKKPGAKKSSSIAIDGLVPQFDTGIKEIKWLSSGCWCIKRSVVEKMVEAYPDLAYDGDDNASGKKIYGLYIPMLYDMKVGDIGSSQSPETKLAFRKYLSEDWSFCERWRAIGGKIYADTSIVLKHIGKIDYSLFDVELIKSTKPVLPSPGFDLEKKL